MRATKVPNAAGGSAQTSTSIGAPAGVDAHQPGLGRRRVRQRVQLVGGRGVGRARTNVPPRSVSWWLSGWPDRCAPTTAIGIASPRPARRFGARRAAPRRSRRASSRWRGAGPTRCSPGRRRCPRARSASRRRAARARIAGGAEAGGDGERRQVEQVDEVRVRPERRVEAARLGLDLVDAVDGRRRRQQQDVDAGQDRVARAGAARAACAGRRRRRGRPGGCAASRIARTGGSRSPRAARASRRPAATSRSATNGPS